MKALKYNSYGEIISHLDMLEEFLDFQVQEGEFLLKDAEADDSKQYVDTNTLELVDFPSKPDIYSIWNWETKAWEHENLWLDRAKKDGVTKVNSTASNKILSIYPDYKQRNMTARYLELSTLNQLETEEALSIKAAWDWVTDIRARSNVATTAVNEATTLPEITTIVDTFKQELAEIS